ncbi:MAG: nitrile hydratase subunit beta [Kiloniellales bacterium]
MDGLHDLGGKEGFGPIAVTEEDPAFQADWEGRMYALSQTVGAEDWTIDWFRYLVELLPPEAYITIPYFEKWCLVALTGLVNSEVATQEEILRAGSTPQSPGQPSPPPQDIDTVLQTVRAKCTDFSRPQERGPAFQIGDAVVTQRHSVPGHTRLPAYARGRHGRVVALHGAHLLPDAVWRGVEAAAPLYTIRFEARELWGPDAVEDDAVMLDLWEPYLLGV